jgi:hypothetical protein
MRIRPLTLAAAAVFGATLLAACGGKSDESMPAATEPMAEPAPMAQARTAAPEGASVFFVTPADGDTVTSPVHIEFGIDGMEVAPAGTDKPASGHHHLLVDTDLPDLDRPIPADANHIHFGDGSTSTDLTLAPGEHTLQLLLGDYRHIPHDPAVLSERITITVE